MSRYRFTFTNASSGTSNLPDGDTGTSVYGEVRQLRWTPSPADTGSPGTLELAVMPVDDDTGMGWVFWKETAANLQAAGGFTRAPVQPVHDTGGTPPALVKGVYFSGDRLRAKVRPGDTGVVINGTLLVWVG